MSISATSDSAVNRVSLAGLCATLIGNGIGRFAFVALMPALIEAGWFSAADASYLGVATLVGYLLGAPVADLLANRWSSAVLLRAAMLLCTVSLFACAVHDAPLPWYYFWRTAAGVCGAILMVLPAPVVLPRHSERVRARASGVVFSGIGLGAALSGALVPLLISGLALTVVVGQSTLTLFSFQGVAGAWLGMGCVCLVLTLLSWPNWPAESKAKPVEASHDRQPLEPDVRRAVGLILLAHGLNAMGYLAHTLFWVDYVVRELGMSLASGGFLWAMFGLGAAIGPVLVGTLADWLGVKRCLIAGFVIKSVAALLPVLTSEPAMLLVSALLMGVFTPGIASLVSAYTLERVGAVHHRRAWGLATTSFALAQAAGGALMAFAATRLSSYQPLFCTSALALVGSVVCIVMIQNRQATPQPMPGMASSDSVVAR